MKGLRGGIFRSGNRSRRDKNRKGKGKGSIRVAKTEVYQGHLEVSRIGKLLLLIHTGLYIYSKTIT